jgi:hypothetical protein
MRTAKETQAMDKAIAEKIAKDYIIESMAKGLGLTLHEGPDYPTGIWGFNPADQSSQQNTHWMNFSTRPMHTVQAKNSIISFSL